MLNRQVRNLDALCRQLTETLNTTRPVERLYTPVHGTPMTHLAQLQDGRTYVAGGSQGRFRHLRATEYGNIPDLRTKEREHRRQGMARQERQERSRGKKPAGRHHGVARRGQQGAATGTGAMRHTSVPALATQGRQISLIRNGDGTSSHVHVLLTARRTLTWGQLYQEASTKMQTGCPIRQICTMSGKRVDSLADFKSGGTYIAVARGRFKRVAYRPAVVTRTGTGAKRALPVISTPRSAKKGPARPTPPLTLPGIRLQHHPVRVMLSRQRSSTLLTSNHDNYFGNDDSGSDHGDPSTSQHASSEASARISPVALMREVVQSQTGDSPCIEPDKGQPRSGSTCTRPVH